MTTTIPIASSSVLERRLNEGLDALKSLSSIKKTIGKFDNDGMVSEYGHNACVTIPIDSDSKGFFWDLFTEIRESSEFFRTGDFRVDLGFGISHPIISYVNDMIKDRDSVFEMIRNRLKNIKNVSEINITIHPLYIGDGFIPLIPTTSFQKICFEALSFSGFYSKKNMTEYHASNFILVIPDNECIINQMRKFISEVSSNGLLNPVEIIATISPFPCLNCFAYGFENDYTIEQSNSEKIKYPGSGDGKCANCQSMFFLANEDHLTFMKNAIESLLSNPDIVDDFTEKYFPRSSSESQTS